MYSYELFSFSIHRYKVGMTVNTQATGVINNFAPSPLVNVISIQNMLD